MLCSNGISGGDSLDVSVIILFVIYMVMNLLIIYIIQRDRLKLSDSENGKDWAQTKHEVYIKTDLWAGYCKDVGRFIWSIKL